MSIDSPEYKNYDVQYSIRLPQDLADEITARAERDGVKPSTWIRNSLAKIIRERDEETANSIKTAVLYLLTADKDIQKQIRLLAEECRENWSRRSKVESAMREFTALTDQEINLQREAEEREGKIAELEDELIKLETARTDTAIKRKELQELIRASEHAENPANSENLQLILIEFREKEEMLLKDSFQIRDQLGMEKMRMEANKAYLRELNDRKKQLLSICSEGVRQDRNDAEDDERTPVQNRQRRSAKSPKEVDKWL